MITDIYHPCEADPPWWEHRPLRGHPGGGGQLWCCGQNAGDGLLPHLRKRSGHSV